MTAPPPGMDNEHNLVRPKAPDPAALATPIYIDPRTPGPHWERSPDQARRRWLPQRRALLLVALVLLVTGVAIGVVATNLVVPQDSAPKAAPAPESSEKPVSSAPDVSELYPDKDVERQQKDPGWPSMTPEPLPSKLLPSESSDPLRENLLYSLEAPKLRGCPQPRVVSSEADWRDEVRAQWQCVHNSWLPIIEEQGWNTELPEVYFFPGKGSKSDCGYFEAPAFYCAKGKGSVFFGGEHKEMAEKWSLSVNEMVNHEYGHHLQSLAGITKAWVTAKGDLKERVRRSELQAVCWSAMMTYNNESVVFDQDALESWNERLAAMRGSQEHGTNRSLANWGSKGLYVTSVGQCNTWTASADEVS